MTMRSAMRPRRPGAPLTLAVTALVPLLLSGCGLFGTSGWSRVNLETVREPIQARVQNGERPPQLSEHQWRHVQRMYAASAFHPVWVGERGFHPRAAVLLDALAAAPSEALRLDAYPIAEIENAISRLREERRPAPAHLAEADVLLSSAYAAYGEDLLRGQIEPRDVAQSWHIDPQDENVDSALVHALRADDFAAALAGLRPTDASYALLRREIGQYREIVARGGWTTVPTGEALRPGEVSTVERMSRLIERLRAAGLAADIEVAVPLDTAAARDGQAVYDERIAGAVARFQERHGIVVDSILGAETVESMNRPAEFRVQQIAANLERHRWLPRALGAQYVLVNVPAFGLDVIESGRSVLSMRVVVGAEYQGRATPVFADSISFLVFQPYWNVPDNIAERDLWPRQRQDPSYFARNNYEVVTAGGRSYVRQRPGPRNALGDVKFMFPNDFAIYLHDTPDDQLFERTVRGFSSGCIRVEKPAELAEYLLRPQGWDLNRVRAAMSGERQDNHVNLERKVPVYIVYFTTYARDGELFFGNDLYERDSRLIEAMAPAVSPDAATVRTAQAALETVREMVRG